MGWLAKPLTPPPPPYLRPHALPLTEAAPGVAHKGVGQLRQAGPAGDMAQEADKDGVGGGRGDKTMQKGALLRGRVTCWNKCGL